ncbi:MAG: helix-turn-helix domain-containing protein [Streptosporangiaceae bacterium]
MTTNGPSNRAQRWTAVVDGQRLRELRRQRGLVQVELAGLAGISAYTLGRLERVPGASCRTRTLARIAAALGEPPATITVVTLADPVTRSDTRS